MDTSPEQQPSRGQGNRCGGLPELDDSNDRVEKCRNQQSNKVAPNSSLWIKLLNSIQMLNHLWMRSLRHLIQLTRSSSRRFKRGAAIATLITVIVLAGHTASAQIAQEPPSQPLGSLKRVRVPEPINLFRFVQNKTAAIALGKALFWDMQVGSDGVMACATCHFHAGADNRSKNQISPGLLRVNDDGSANPDIKFDPPTGGGANYQLKAENFPFHKLADPNNRGSNVVSDSNDVASSQGVFFSKFEDIQLGQPEDKVLPEPDVEGFKVGDTNVRRVEPRNTPTSINAVFNFRNFWDGRAQDIFNGVNPFGLRDPNAFVLRAVGSNRLRQVKVRLRNSSLASQSVGPPTSKFEMSADNRPFFKLQNPTPVDTESSPESSDDSSDNKSQTKQATQDLGEGARVDPQLETLNPLFDREFPGKLVPKKLGKKMLSLRPLGKQIVHPQDSVLGPYSQSPNPGLKVSYQSLIQAAFRPQWWKSDLIVSFDDQRNGTIMKRPNRPLTTNEVTLMEYNFSLFFGLAVQAYEATLVSNNAPVDRYFEGNRGALTAQQRRGLEIFQNKGKCINCHGGPEFTNASVRNVRNERIEPMVVGDGGKAVYDNGFYNIGVRPTQEDLGVGANEPPEIGGKPLSETRLAQQGLFEQFLGARPNERVDRNQRITADGAFKTPGLRNIELTAPYFHNGGQLTLEQVVAFYNRGGDFHEKNIANLDADIQNLNLSSQEQADLVAFLKALTDERVRYRRAPFDHPQLRIPNGHPGDQNSVTKDPKVQTQATDELLEIPAVGRSGGQPLPNFLSTSGP